MTREELMSLIAPEDRRGNVAYDRGATGALRSRGRPVRAEDRSANLTGLISISALRGAPMKMLRRRRHLRRARCRRLPQRRLDHHRYLSMSECGPNTRLGPPSARSALRAAARGAPAGVRELVASVLRRCRPPLGETTVEIVGASRIGHARHDRVANFLTQVGYPKQAALVARLGHLASGVVVVCEDGAIVVATVAAKPLGDA